MSEFRLPAGIAIGHAGSESVRTGVTLLLPERPVVMAVDVRGGGPGTRETDALNPANMGAFAGGGGILR